MASDPCVARFGGNATTARCPYPIRVRLNLFTVCGLPMNELSYTVYGQRAGSRHGRVDSADNAGRNASANACAGVCRGDGCAGMPAPRGRATAASAYCSRQADDVRRRGNISVVLPNVWAVQDGRRCVIHAALSATRSSAEISAFVAPAIGPILTPSSRWMRSASAMLGDLTPREIWLA